MAAFLTMISPGPAVGIGGSSTTKGVLTYFSHAAWFFSAVNGCECFSILMSYEFGAMRRGSDV